MIVLLLADHDNATLNPATAKAMSAAKALGGDIHVLVAGGQCQAVAEAAAKLDGAAKIIVVQGAASEHQIAEALAEVIVPMMAGYDALVGCSTARAKNVLPRVAALLDTMQISDVTKVVAPDTFERPIYAGNAVQTVQSPAGAKIVMTIRTASFPAVAMTGSAAISQHGATISQSLSVFEKSEVQKNDRPELTSAKIVISGGRGMGSGENYRKYIEPVADRLGAAMGASRAAVDAGFVPNDYQVGQTGKVVAPDLYIAVGISGAIQHLAGMKDSKVIVAINKDGEAPIFQVADYGLVADLFQALPELEKELAKAKA